MKIKNWVIRNTKTAASIFLSLAIVISSVAIMAMADNSTMTGSGTSSDPYIITTATQLASIPSAGLNCDFKLGNDIDLTSYGTWTPIGTSSSLPFEGTLDGDNYKITGLTIGTSDTPSTSSYLGLFGYVSSGATIENVNVDVSIYSTGDYIGGIAGYNSGGTVSGCCSTGTLSGSCNQVGGLVGFNGATVSGCYSTAAVSGGSFVGGLVGNNNCKILNCYSTGTVSGSGTCTGGFVGRYYTGTITNCYSTGAVSGRSSVGGFIGYVLESYSEVLNCYSTGAVSGKTSVGGFIGYSNATESKYISKDSWDYSNSATGMNGANFSGKTSTANITGMTTTDMKTQAFADTLNANISSLSLTDCASWKYSADINDGYPYLDGVGVSEAASDTTAPTGTYTLSPSDSTSGPVTINFTASDNVGVASITLPDGSVVNSDTATYSVSENGSYNFVVTDISGNEATITATVSNINSSDSSSNTSSTTSSDSSSSSSDSNSSDTSSTASSGSDSSSSVSSDSGSSSISNTTSSQVDTVAVDGTINGSTISVTHPANITYAISSDGAFTSPAFDITNTGTGTVGVTVESLKSIAGGTLQFTDVAADAEDWNNLGLSGSKTYIALGIAADTSTSWNSDVYSETYWAVNNSSMLIGTIKSGATAALQLTAKNGHVFDQSYTAKHELILEFDLT